MNVKFSLNLIVTTPFPAYTKGTNRVMTPPSAKLDSLEHLSAMTDGPWGFKVLAMGVDMGWGTASAFRAPPYSSKS